MKGIKKKMGICNGAYILVEICTECLDDNGLNNWKLKQREDDGE